MSHLKEIPTTVLASLLESVQDNEGILVCRDELREWADEAVCRAFATYQFDLFRGIDDGLTFSHADSGTSLCYNGIGVTLATGGNITEAMPDLLRALHDLGWRNIDVYSAHGEDLYYDLARYIPAHIELELHSCDIPTDANNDLRALSEMIESRQNGGPSTEEQFMDVLRGEVGMPPLASTAVAVESPSFTPPVDAKPGMGVALNYIPDIGSDDPMDFAPQVPGLGSGGIAPSSASIATPSAPRAFTGGARPVFELSTGSPVAELGAASPSTPASPSLLPVEASRPPAPATISAVKLATAEVIEETHHRSAPHAPAARVKGVDEKNPASSNTKSGTALPFARPVVSGNLEKDLVRQDVPVGPVEIGDAVVLLDTPWHRLDAAHLSEWQSDGGKQREIVRIEPGTHLLSKQHANWSPLMEFNSIADDWPLLQGLVSAMWPTKGDFLPMLGSLLLLKAESTAGTPPQLGDLFGLAMLDSDTLIERMTLNEDEMLQEVLPFLLPLRQRQAMEATLRRLAEDIGPLVLIDNRKAGNLANSPHLSFVDVARGGDSRIFVVALDSMDLDGPAEMFASGLMRWVGRLAETQRLSFAKTKSAAEAEASKVLEGMSPEMREALQKVLSLNR